ncbi:MAG TPA: EutN/CcmL family microcompartment protein [Terriglobales bacterium]|jgi:ethanolamine utilization protein EutN|nr:EutN/CcmL family microcompartment protein [Terriglobales bacterium]
MIIARVVGEVVATRKHASHEGRKVLLVQPVNPDDSERGEPVLALDAVDAGIGDRVLVVQEGYAAMSAAGRPNSPIDMTIVGVVDAVELDEPRV